jgi:hypothetical protein
VDFCVAEVTRPIGGVLAPFLIASAASFGVYWLTARYGIVRLSRVQRLPSVLAATFGVYVSSFTISGILLSHLANKRLEALAGQQIHSLVIHFEGRKTEIRDRTVISEFWSTICSAGDAAVFYFIGERVGASNSWTFLPDTK